MGGGMDKFLTSVSFPPIVPSSPQWESLVMHEKTQKDQGNKHFSCEKGTNVLLTLVLTHASCKSIN